VLEDEVQTSLVVGGATMTAAAPASSAARALSTTIFVATAEQPTTTGMRPPMAET
jgi:hypothetical protein